MAAIIEPRLVSKDTDPMNPFRHSADSSSPDHSPRSSMINQPPRQPPSAATLNHSPPTRDLEAANNNNRNPAPAYTEFYAPTPSTAYYPPISNNDAYDHATGRRQNPYYDRYGYLRHPGASTAQAPREGDRSWVWESSSWCSGYNGQGWSPSLCGFRTRNMPPSQIACLLILTLVMFGTVIAITVVAVNARSRRYSSGN